MLVLSRIVPRTVTGRVPGLPRQRPLSGSGNLDRRSVQSRTDVTDGMGTHSVHTVSPFLTDSSTAEISASGKP